MSTQIQLRNPTLEDIYDMVVAATRMAKEDFDRPDKIDRVYFMEKAQESVNNPGCWVARVDGNFAGLLLSYTMDGMYCQNRKTQAEWIFYVLPEYRKTKVTSMLIKEFESYAKKIGCKEVVMCSTVANNLRLDRRGYKEIPTSYSKEI